MNKAERKEQKEIEKAKRKIQKEMEKKARKERKKLKKRERKKAPISFRAYHDLYVLLLFLHIFGLRTFGTRPATKALYKKYKFFREAQAKNVEFAETLNTAQQKNHVYTDVEPYLPALNEAIPGEVYGDEEIVEVLLLVSPHAYKLEDVNFSERGGNYTKMTVSLEGSFKNLDSLLKSIEASPLSLSVENVSVSFTKKLSKEDQISLSLKLYNLPDSEKGTENAPEETPVTNSTQETPKKEEN
ncbi:hypothetical protein GF360_01210 [candidate division WWE3 bacterium]|nr:hypothetical protein [candidate division WWE3 bacterium]